MDIRIFLNYFNELMDMTQSVMPEEVQEVYNMLISMDKDKPLFTETGLSILEFMRATDTKSTKAKDIAEGMGISSRTVSGALRKLVADKFVDKFGSNPVVYTLSNKGKEFNIKEYKEKNYGKEIY